MKIFKFFIIISFVAINMIGCNSSKNNISQEAFNQGKLALANKEYDKAISHFKLSINEGNNDVEVKNLLEAVELYNEALYNFNQKNINKAKEYINKIDINSVDSYIKDDIKKLKSNIENTDTNKLLDKNEEKKDNTEKENNITEVSSKNKDIENVDDTNKIPEWIIGDFYNSFGNKITINENRFDGNKFDVISNDNERVKILVYYDGGTTSEFSLTKSDNEILIHAKNESHGGFTHIDSLTKKNSNLEKIYGHWITLDGAFTAQISENSYDGKFANFIYSEDDTFILETLDIDGNKIYLKLIYKNHGGDDFLDIYYSYNYSGEYQLMDGFIRDSRYN